MMIEINLLSEEFKPKSQSLDTRQLRQVLLIGVPVLFGLLLLIHLYLGCLLFIKSVQYRSMNKKWAQQSSPRRKVEAWKSECKISSQQSEEIERLLKQRITIADKMQVLAQALPGGIWFNQLTLEGKLFSLKGSVVSLQEDQMRLLNSFLGRLKKEAGFFDDFSRLETGRITMRSLAGLSIMNFILEGELK
jgi:Tfp pilus assembly protein PilN